MRRVDAVFMLVALPRTTLSPFDPNRKSSGPFCCDATQHISLSTVC